jgi:hypothetical protein
MAAPPRALVTGASEGIGRAFALRLAREGFAVTAVARNEARLQDLLAQLGTGHDCRAADLATPEGIRALAAHIAQSPYQLLINNAAIGLYGDFAELPLEDLQRLLRLNVDALVALSHAFLRQARAGDTLINVSSILAFLPLPANGVYAATKAFVTAFSEALWRQQRARGVYVLGLCPGATATEFHARAGAKRRTAGGMTQTPEQVVAEAMQALRARRSPTVVTGWRNRIAVLAFRFLSRRAVVSALDRGTRVEAPRSPT